MIRYFLKTNLLFVLPCELSKNFQKGIEYEKPAFFKHYDRCEAGFFPLVKEIDQGKFYQFFMPGYQKSSFLTVLHIAHSVKKWQFLKEIKSTFSQRVPPFKPKELDEIAQAFRFLYDSYSSLEFFEKMKSQYLALGSDQALAADTKDADAIGFFEVQL